MADLFIDEEYPEYLKPISKKLQKKYGFVREIAPGNSGITFVLRSKSNSNLYCLKTISHLVRTPAERERVTETLKKEVEILGPLNHRCLPTIFDHDLRGALPYYVCTFHPGETWERFRISKKKLQLSEAIFVIASLIDVLEYLHQEGRTHCDLHGNNILISEKVFGEGILIIDFGSGHRGSEDSAFTDDKGHGGFKNVRGQQQHRLRVRRSDAMREFRDYDFTALGKALSGMQPAFFSGAPFDQNIAYLDFCSMLQDGVAKTWAQVRERFEHVVDPVWLLTKTERLFVAEDGKRDAWHCGLPYGDGFNIDEVLNGFRCGPDAKKLFIRDSHVHAIEGFMIVQDQMLSAVYWHPTVRAVFAMFHGFLAGTVGDDEKKIIELVEQLKQCTNEYHALYNVFLPMLRGQRKGDDNELWQLMKLHYEPNFADIYKPIQRFSFDDPVNPKLNSSTNVFQSIVILPGMTARTGVPINRNQIRRLIQCFRSSFDEKGARPGRFEVLVDVPWGKSSNRMLQVVDENGKNEKDITEASHLANTIFENPTAYSAPIRVYISPRLFSEYQHESGSIIQSALEKYFDLRAVFKESAAT